MSRIVGAMPPRRPDLPAVPELGHPGALIAGYTGSGTPTWLAGSWEETPELEFPYSIPIFDRMRRTESQIGGILSAIALPVTKTRRYLDTDGVNPQVVQVVDTELGLSRGKGRGRRRRQGIVWSDHLRLLLLALPLGFAPFEQVYEPGTPTADQDLVSLPRVAHLRKLGLRHPRTIQAINVDSDGGLKSITQTAPGYDTYTPGHGGTGRVVMLAPTGVIQYRAQTIGVERLVMYCLNREGADWAGNSILRNSYKNWLIKDMLLRVSAQAVERNGMGLPVVGFDPNTGSQDEAQQIASQARAGATAGIALPTGYTFHLEGVTGATADALPLIAYHDQAMSRSALAMFLDLGHDNGARSLGDTFVDYFTASVNVTNEWIDETTTEHVIRDLVELNYGPDEPYPVLRSDPVNSESTPTAQALGVLADAGLLGPVDDGLIDDVRQRYGLPALPAAMPYEPAPTEIPGQVPDTPPASASPADIENLPEMAARTQMGELRDLVTRLEQLGTPRRGR